MAKKITGYVKLQVPAGAANPSPPIGPALGQRGLNIMEFCKAFNAQTQKLEKGAPIPVTITVYADRSFTFEMRKPPVSHFLKKAAKLESGSKTPGRDIAGSVTKAQVREIAEQKMKDLNCDTIESAMRMIEGLRPLDGAGGEGMSTLGKRTTQGARRRRPRKALSARRGGEDGQGTRQGEVRRDRRNGDESRRRSAPCRPEGARRRQSAERLRPLGARRGVRARRQGRRGQGRRCRCRRRRGSGREGAGRRHRLRSRRRHARSDAAGRPSRQGAWARAA